MKTQYTLIVTVLFFILFSKSAIAAYDVWEEQTPYPVKVYGDTAASYDGVFYGISGAICIQIPDTNQVYGYSSTNNAWEVKAPIPTPRAMAGAATIDGKIYVVGGCENTDCRAWTTNVLEAYDVVTNSWSTKTPMPSSRGIAVVGVIDGKLYVAGGGGPNYVESNVLEVYDPNTDGWETKQPLPITLAGAMGAVVDGKLYALGGSSGNLNNAVLDKVFRYDPIADSWSEVAPMPTSRLFGGAGVIDGKIYVAGGSNYGGLISTVDVYDPTSNTWTTLSSPLPTPRYFQATAVVGRTLYVAGGVVDNYCSDKFESYTPAPLYNFGGFLQPVSLDKPFKLGSTIPVKFQLTDSSGAYITTAKATISLQKYSNDTPYGDAIDALSTTGADAGNLFRYDSIENQYIFNLNTKNLSLGTWQIRVVLDDGTEAKTSFISLK